MPSTSREANVIPLDPRRIGGTSLHRYGAHEHGGFVR
jgi:hypothetical protein